MRDSSFASFVKNFAVDSEQELKDAVDKLSGDATKRIMHLLWSHFHYHEPSVLVGFRIKEDNSKEMFAYGTTGKLYFRVKPLEDMSDIAIHIVPPSDEKTINELKQFFGQLPESVTTYKPNTNRN